MTFLRSLRRAEVLIALGVLACFILIGWLDYQRNVQAAAKFDTFSSFDYHKGGYRAWYDLLRREGVRVGRYERRAGYLNDTVATLIVSNNQLDAIALAQVGKAYGSFSEADLAAMRKWVASGGRLIWLVDEGSEVVLAPLRIGSELRLPAVRGAGPARDEAISLTPAHLTDGVRRVSGTSRLRIPFRGNFHVIPLVADKAGVVVGAYHLGKGSVIVVTDESLFSNADLGKADNARLAYNLASFGLRSGETVAFEEWSHGFQTGDTWWTILPRTFRAAFLIAGSALLLLLLGVTLRFGPAARLPENTERTSEEYLTSMATLMERGGAARKAVRDLARLALHDAARSAGVPDATPASGIAARLRGTSSGDRRAGDLITLERLGGYEHPTPAELVKAARLCNALRKDFAPDGYQRFESRRTARRRSA